MSRMLLGLESKSSKAADIQTLPPTVKKILGAIFDLWRVRQETAEKWLY
jgi:hypothetical protein